MVQKKFFLTDKTKCTQECVATGIQTLQNGTAIWVRVWQFQLLKRNENLC